jgi:peroxiredoxin Q/BCP
MALQVGDEAPNFQLPDQLGDIHELTTYRGHWVLLYFYPKDDTSGCTAEACAIRDNQRDFTLNDLTILGVSTDPVESHRKFAEKYDLPFTLLSDTDKIVVKLYDVWKPKKMMGKEYIGTHRDSFLIDPNGVIAKIYQGVTPAKHAAEVLADIELLKQ